VLSCISQCAFFITGAPHVTLFVLDLQSFRACINQHTLGGPKRKLIPFFNKLINLNPANQIASFFVKLQYQRTTIILAAGIRYSTRDLICHVNY